MTFDPIYVEVTCVTLPKDHYNQVPWEYINICGYSDQFCKWPTKDHWPLDDFDPTSVKSYVWLYPRIIVSKSHENTSKYVDTVTFFAKNLNQRFKYHCVQVPWEYINVCGYSDQFCKLPHTFYILHTTYILNLHTYYVQNHWSHSLSQARQKLSQWVSVEEPEAKNRCHPKVVTPPTHWDKHI